jgi:hypothetical protein
MSIPQTPSFTPNQQSPFYNKHSSSPFNENGLSFSETSTNNDIITIEENISESSSLNTSFNSSFDSPENETTNEEVDTINNTFYISAISEILNKLIQTNQKQNKPEMLTYFHSETIPQISLMDYLLRIQQYSNIELSTLIISLIYLDRIYCMNKLTLNFHNIHKLLLTSVLMSIKYNEDSLYRNDYFAEIGGVSLKELNQMEIEFLSGIQFNLFVNNDLYDKYYESLSNYRTNEFKL